MRRLIFVLILAAIAAVCTAQPVVETQLRSKLKGVALFDSSTRPSIKIAKLSPRITATGLTGTALDTLDLARQGATTGQILTWADGWKPRNCCSLLDTAYNALTKIPYPSRAVKWGGPQTETTTITSPAGSYNITFTGQRQHTFSASSVSGDITSVFENRALASGTRFIYTNTSSQQTSRFVLGGPTGAYFTTGSTVTAEGWGMQGYYGGVEMSYTGPTVGGQLTKFGIGTTALKHQGIDVKNWGDTILVMSQNGSGFLRPISAWDKNSADDITTSTAAGGDLDGTYPNPVVDGIQGRPVASTAPTTGQVFKWNGSAWAPAADDAGTSGVTSVVGGTGISVSTVGTVATVTNTGDTNAADDLTTSTNFSGDLTGIWNNLQLIANSVTTAEIAPNTVTGGDIAAATITAFNMANNSIGTNQIINNGVQTEDILDHGIQSVDLDTFVVEPYHIQDFSIASDKMTFTGVTPGLYGFEPAKPAYFQVDNAGRLTIAGQHDFTSNIYWADGVSYLQLNELHNVAEISGALGNITIGLGPNLHQGVQYNLICDQNSVNTISFIIPSGSAFKFSNILGGAATTFNADEGAHYALIRNGTKYIISKYQ